jgi:hypothetical protein
MYDGLNLSFLNDTNQHWDEFLTAYFGLPPVAQGWQGSVGSDWNDPGNWSAGINPGPQVIAEFNTPTDQQPVIGRDTTIMGVSLETPGWTIGGTGETLSVGTGGIDSAGDGINTVDPNVVMGTDSSWAVGDENTLVLNGTFGGGNNTLTKDGAGRLVIAGGQDPASGLALNVGAGTVQFAPAAGPLVLSSLSVADTGGVPTARLDLASGQLIVDYHDAAASPLEDIKRWIAAGYNGMTWTGNGLTSSAAAVNPLIYGVGYAQNDRLFAPYSSFAGQVVDSSCVLVKYTYAGDLNLDGRVDDNDVSILGLYYDGGAVNTHYWNQGDLFGYDGRIDDNDVSILGLTYGLGVGNPLGGGAAGVTLAAPTEPAAQPAAALAPSPVALGASESSPVAALVPSEIGVVDVARQESLAPAASDSAASSGAEALLAAAGAAVGSSGAVGPVAALEVTAMAPPLAWQWADRGEGLPAADGGTLDLLSLPALAVLAGA